MAEAFAELMTILHWLNRESKRLICSFLTAEALVLHEESNRVSSAKRASFEFG